jgi:uncharacterized membrane protein YoaK (UPF0700 family)
MELAELQMQWQQLDEKLDRNWQVDRELLRLTFARSARRSVNRLVVWPVVDIVLSVATILWTGLFLYHHWRNWELVGSAGVVLVGAVTLLLSSAHQLRRLWQIDWDGAVAEIQGALSRLRVEKIRQFKWVILAAPLVGFCGFVVAVQWLLDWLPEAPSIFSKFNPWWVASNYVFGVLFLMFGPAIVRFCGRKFRSHTWWQRAADDISGRSINQARRELERWKGLAGELASGEI